MRIVPFAVLLATQAAAAQETVEHPGHHQSPREPPVPKHIADASTKQERATRELNLEQQGFETVGEGLGFEAPVDDNVENDEEARRNLLQRRRTRLLQSKGNEEQPPQFRNLGKKNKHKNKKAHKTSSGGASAVPLVRQQNLPVAEDANMMEIVEEISSMSMSMSYGEGSHETGGGVVFTTPTSETPVYPSRPPSGVWDTTSTTTTEATAAELVVSTTTTTEATDLITTTTTRDYTDVCSCSPQTYNVRLSLTQLCDVDDIENNNGIGLTLCVFQTLDKDDDDDDENGDSPAQSRFNTPRLLLDEVVRHRRDLGHHKHDAKVAALALQKTRQSINNNNLPLDEVTIIDVQFLEFGTQGDLTVINQDDRDDQSLKNGDMLVFNSISQDLNPALPIGEQADYIPGGVQITLRGRLNEAQDDGSVVEKVVNQRLTWSYTNGCFGEGVPVNEGDRIGWLTFESLTHADRDFCPVAPTTTTTSTTTTSTTTTTTTAAAVTEEPSAPPTPPPTLSPITPFPTMSYAAKSSKMSKASWSKTAKTKTHKDNSMSTESTFDSKGGKDVLTSAKSSKMLKSSKNGFSVDGGADASDDATAKTSSTGITMMDSKGGKDTMAKVHKESDPAMAKGDSSEMQAKTVKMGSPMHTSGKAGSAMSNMGSSAKSLKVPDDMSMPGISPLFSKSTKSSSSMPATESTSAKSGKAFDPKSSKSEETVHELPAIDAKAQKVSASTSTTSKASKVAKQVEKHHSSLSLAFQSKQSKTGGTLRRQRNLMNEEEDVVDVIFGRI